MQGEKNGIPVEIAMVYNSSFLENLHSFVNNINTHEGHTSFRLQKRDDSNFKKVCRIFGDVG